MKIETIRRYHLTTRLAGAASLILGTLFGFPTTALAAPPEISPEIMAKAIVKSGMIYVSVQWRAWLRGADGVLMSPSPYEATTTCSGFVANSSGFIVTAGNCVDDATLGGGKITLIRAVVQDLVETGQVDPGKFDATVQQASLSWKVQGNQAGAPPERRVSVYQPVEAGGVSALKPMTASVVAIKSAATGDAALLKIETATPLPVLEVGQATTTGEEVISAGFPGLPSDTADPNVDPRCTVGQITGQPAAKGVSFTEISPANSTDTVGGPVVNLDGSVIGTVSAKPGKEDAPTTLATSVATLQSLLSSSGVRNELTQQDVAYRAGLADYFAGHYHEAVGRFDTVLAASPNHAMAQLYRGNAISRYPSERANSRGPALLAAAVGCVIVACYLILTLLGRRRRRNAETTSAVAPAAEQAVNSALPSQSHQVVQAGQAVFVVSGVEGVRTPAREIIPANRQHSRPRRAPASTKPIRPRRKQRRG